MSARTVTLARRLSQLTDDNLNEEYAGGPGVTKETCEKDAKLIGSISPECKNLLHRYSLSKSSSEDSEASDAQVSRAFDGMSAHDKAARRKGKQNHIQLQRRLTKSHNQK